MNYFCKIEDNVSYSTWLDYLKKYKGHVLSLSTFTISSEDSITGHIQIKIPVTFHEEETVYIHTDKVYEELSKYTNYQMEFANEQLMSALNKLHYYDLYKFFNGLYDYNHDPFEVDNLYLNRFNIDIDYFSIFHYFYGNLMDVKTINKEE